MTIYKALKDKIEITEEYVKLHHWGGESFIKVKSPISGSPLSEEKNTHDRHEKKVSKFKQIHADKEIHVYEVDKHYEEWDSDGDLEYEIHLKKKPDSNIFDLEIEHSGDLDFFFQPEQPPKPGIQTDPKMNDPWDPNELDHGEHRGSDLWPEVLNSYCVYHKFKTGNKYKAGKFGQIFRPKAFDANGNWVWCDFDKALDPGLGILRIVVPQEFLDNAKYPVVIDPTFGYETNATAGSQTLEGQIAGSLFTSNFAGNVTNISIYSNASVTTRTWAGGVYLHGDLSLIGGEDLLNAGGTGLRWNDCPISPALGVVNGAGYVLMARGSSSSGTHVIWYDTGAADQGHTIAGTTWPNPLGSPTHSTRLYAIHADGVAVYTETLLSIAVSAVSILALQQFVDILTDTIQSQSSIVDTQDYLQMLQSLIASESTRTDIQNYLQILLDQASSISSMEDFKSLSENLQSILISVSTVEDFKSFVETLLDLGQSSSGISDLQNYVQSLSTVSSSISSTADLQQFINIIASVIASFSSLSDAQNYIETLQTNVSSLSQAAAIQSYVDLLVSTAHSVAAIQDLQAYAETLQSIIQSSSSVIDVVEGGGQYVENLLSLIISASSVQDVQAYVQQMVSVLYSISSVEDKASMIENLTTLIQSGALLSDLQNYIEILQDSVMSGSSLDEVLSGPAYENLLSTIISRAGVYDYYKKPSMTEAAILFKLSERHDFQFEEAPKFSFGLPLGNFSVER